MSRTGVSRGRSSSACIRSPLKDVAHHQDDFAGPHLPGRSRFRDGCVHPVDGSVKLSSTMDEIDSRIVDALRADGRASITAVAEAAHVSRANAYARLSRLVEEGVITGFTAKVDPRLSGRASSAYVTMRVEQASWHELRDRLQTIPEVEHFALVGGDFDVILL